MRDMASIVSASMSAAIEWRAAAGHSPEKQHLEAAGVGDRPTAGIRRSQADGCRHDFSLSRCDICIAS